MKKTIFFDLGGVLLNFSHARMCDQIATLCDLPVSRIQKLLFEEGFGQQIERGALDNGHFHSYLCTLTGRSLDFASLMHAASDIFTVKTECLPLLQDLKKKGHELILLSNTCEAHFSFAQRHFPFLRLFDDFILSYEVGARKPEKAIFNAALQKANASLENCFYTDDIADYVETAKSMGLDAHQFTDAQDLKVALQKRDLL